ncbi:MAG: UDP-2,4-diacetamido-2,4,6-trideoxy-beta-L-altropyranose hydrolase [bacterium]
MIKNSRNILFRTDANPEIGLGHLSRCVSLALEFKKLNHNVIFVIRNNDTAKEYLAYYELDYIIIDNMIAKKEMQFISKIVEDNKVKIVFIDSYELNSNSVYLNFFKKIKNITVVTIEGFKKYPVQGDIIINPNLFASDKVKFYDQKKSKLLFGINYSLLKPDYLNAALNNKERNNILVTFGGSDSQNATIPILNALKDLKHSILVVIGPFFDERNTERIKQICNLHDNISCFENLTDLKSLYKKSFIAICAAGVTVSELIYFNIPALVYYTSDNQKLIAQKYDGLQLGLNLGDFNDFDNEFLKKKLDLLVCNRYSYFLKNNKKKMKGNPVRRVVEEITDYIK